MVALDEGTDLQVGWYVLKAWYRDPSWFETLYTQKDVQASYDRDCMYIMFLPGESSNNIAEERG